MKKYGIYLGRKCIEIIEAKDYMDAVKVADSLGYVWTKFDVRLIKEILK